MFEELTRDLLRPDETILWTGRPETSVRFAAGDAFLIPLGLMLLSGGIYVVVSVLGGLLDQGAANKIPPAFVLAAAPMLLPALHLLFLRFLVKRHDKLRTFFLVTNQRALAIRRGMRKKVMAMDVRRVCDVTKSIRPDGIGTIYLRGSGPDTQFRGAITENVGIRHLVPSTKEGAVGFYDIKNVNEVYRLVYELKKSTSEPGD